MRQSYSTIKGDMEPNLANAFNDINVQYLCLLLVTCMRMRLEIFLGIIGILSKCKVLDHLLYLFPISGIII